MTKVRDVIVDTDIGDTLDSVWAILFLLSLPNVRIRLISVTNGDVAYRASLLARILTETGHDGVPIALGRDRGPDRRPFGAYADFPLEEYRGRIYGDYRTAYSELLAEGGQETDILCLAPFTALASVTDVLHRCSAAKLFAVEDEAAAHGRFAADPPAAKSIFDSNFDLVLLPDALCRAIRFDEGEHARLASSENVFARTAVSLEELWYGRTQKSTREGDLRLLACVWMTVFPHHFKMVRRPRNAGEDPREEGDRILCAAEIAKQSQMKEFSAAALTGKPPEATVEYDYRLFIAQKRSNTDLSITECGWEQCPPFSRFGPTARYYYILHFVESGSGYFIKDGKRTVINKNQAFLLKPGEVTVYGAVPENPWKYHWVGFSGVAAKGLIESCGFGGDNCIINVHRPEQVLRHMEEIVELYDDSDAAEYGMLGNLYLVISLLMSGRNVEREEELSANPIGRAVEHINSNYMLDLKIEELSRLVGFARSYFYKKFVERMGVSPKDYLTAVRMTKAVGLMKSGAYTLDQIARLVGYDDYTNFARIFKKYYKVSPKEYRLHPFESSEAEEAVASGIQKEAQKNSDKR